MPPPWSPSARRPAASTQAALDLAQPDFVLPLAGLRTVLERLRSRGAEFTVRLPLQPA